MRFRFRMLARACALPLFPLVTGCAGDTEPPPAASPPLAADSSAETPPPGTAGGAQTSVGGLSEPYVDRGVCPFECCLYREWRTDAALPVFAAERDTTRMAYTIPAGEVFTAVTGNVHLSQVGIAVARDTITLGYPPEPTTRLEVGDTVYILSPRGEGTFGLIHEGREVVGEGFWVTMYLNQREAVGTLLREPITEWWVQVRDRNGREGWINMDRNGQAVSGADACA